MSYEVSRLVMCATPKQLGTRIHISRRTKKAVVARQWRMLFKRTRENLCLQPNEVSKPDTTLKLSYAPNAPKQINKSTKPLQCQFCGAAYSEGG